MAFHGRLAKDETLSRKLIKASLDNAAFTLAAVSARDVSWVLDTVLEGLGYRTGIDVIEESREVRGLKYGLSR